MNFKIKPIALLLSCAAITLTGCKDDMLGDGNDRDNLASGSYVHVSAGISLPSTRSATDAGPTDPADGSSTNNDQTNSNATPDYEYGFDYENEIRTMILVYATQDNKFITHSIVNGITKAPANNTQYDYEVVGEIAHETLQSAYENNILTNSGSTPQGVKVFAICNYTDNLYNKFTNDAVQGQTDWIDWVGTVNEGHSDAGSQPTIQNTIWAPRSFLMSNYSMANVKFPATLDEWDNYTDKNTPWLLNADGDQEGSDLTAIQVERSAARLDFRDASEDGDQVYKLKIHEESYGDTSKDDPDTQDPNGDLNLVSIKLNRMALVNMSKNFYYFRRVSDDGTMNGANFAYLGREKMTGGDPKTANYVVDCDAQDKKAVGGMSLDKEKTNFNFPLYKLAENGTDTLYNKSAWYVDNISQVLSGPTDSWTGWTGDPDKRYHIWRYITENTIPEAENQKTVQSTGIVFKARIEPGDDIKAITSDDDPAYKYMSKDVVTALNNPSATSAILYSFENRLFAGPKDLVAAAVLDGENSALYGAVNAVLKNWKKGTDGNYKLDKTGTGDALTVKDANDIYTEGTAATKLSDLTDANVSPLAPDAKITVYRATDENDGEGYGYYCYYFYWLRHNDNNKSGLMGPMEFASVRNNVYKLAVTSIGKIGHPTNPGDDPDPEEPGDPDEDPTNYIKVDVEVLPWVVRVNDIEF
ncbi:MAG: Mfa1 fimbrilin C-terminal domain-containing protein [Muribaculaceae bacterium]|nr:Mfa1 fimbrilin C-terminal domain-containing protein [Muribaculaceae bacterium]